MVDIIPKGENLLIENRFYGSLDYAPPEVNFGMKKIRKITYSKSIDIWLLGEMLFGMLTGHNLHKSLEYKFRWEILDSKIARRYYVLENENRKRLQI